MKTKQLLNLFFRNTTQSNVKAIWLGSDNSGGNLVAGESKPDTQKPIVAIGAINALYNEVKGLNKALEFQNKRIKTSITIIRSIHQQKSFQS